MGRLIIGDFMNKKKKVKYRRFVLKKYFIVFFLFLFFLLSYFEVSGFFNFNVFFNDFLFFPARKISSYEFIDGINLELKNENKMLKKLLLINDSLTDFSIIYSVVIERNNSYWFNYVTINKGSNDGISKGMAVVDSNGLVGVVDSVSLNTSVVSLITTSSYDNNISVNINSFNEILSFDSGNFVIRNVDCEILINIGDKVYTSGLSEKFPSGILIGEVSLIKKNDFGNNYDVYIDLASNINSLRYVAVLKRG